MLQDCARAPRVSRRTPLAICLALALAAGPVTATTAARVVSNCDDAGPGSLRDTLSSAQSGDTVDLSSLSCATITLTSGALAIQPDDLTVHGPGAASLTIDAAGNSLVFDHQGAGTLALERLTIRGGAGYFVGGCVHGAHDVSVSDSVFEDCAVEGFAVSGAAIGAGNDVVLARSTISNSHARATSYAPYVATVRGGAVWAAISVTMVDSTISGVDISASSDDGDAGVYGGGIYAFSGVTMTRSRIENATSVGSGGFVLAFGGGAESVGIVELTDSTVVGNTIDVSGARIESIAGGGGLRIAPAGSNTVSLLRSTISDNAVACNGACPYAYLYGGGIATYAQLTLANTTISGNRSDGAGGGIRAMGQNASVSLWNTTITDNSAREGMGISSYHGPIATESSIVAADIALFGRALEIETDSDVTGSHNVIASANVLLPPDTITDDPMLGPLADNGGPTRTHALLAGSPAIDAGDDVLNLDSDQRGGSFVRVFGAAADIGAFESQPDILFSNGFDG